MSHKIDSEGNYLPFPGFTVVADVYQTNRDLFDELHRRLRKSELITRYNSLLPAESYHITTFAVITPKHSKMLVGEDDRQWQYWIEQNMTKLHSMHKSIESTLTPFNFRITGCQDKRLTLMVQVDPLAETAQKDLAKVVGYKKDVPRYFHISLAYQYRPFEDPSIVGRIAQELNEILQEILPNYPLVDLPAMQPHLCYYHDMCEFVPWDATTNPFEPTYRKK
jgi:hypothetical protein